MKNISCILLAGGSSSRFGNNTKKQFIKLNDEIVAIYSLKNLIKHPDILEVIVVCKESDQRFFTNFDVKFALAGTSRQKSVENGLSQVSKNSSWICIHDSARPFIEGLDLNKLFLEGKNCGASAFGIPVRSTIKSVNSSNMVIQTIPRNELFEIQTPQFISKELLLQGINFANENNISVTDDVSFAEILNKPVYIVPGCSSNIKITYKTDLQFAASLQA